MKVNENMGGLQIYAGLDSAQSGLSVKFLSQSFRYSSPDIFIVQQDFMKQKRRGEEERRKSKVKKILASIIFHDVGASPTISLDD